MIDDPEQVTTLMEKMAAHLPIHARATKALLPNLKTSKPVVQIVKVIYMGDEGGISCKLKLPGQEKSAFIVSLTHLRLANTHPLAQGINAHPLPITRRFPLKYPSWNT